LSTAFLFFPFLPRGFCLVMGASFSCLFEAGKGHVRVRSFGPTSSQGRGENSSSPPPLSPDASARFSPIRTKPNGAVVLPFQGEIPPFFRSRPSSPRFSWGRGLSPLSRTTKNLFPPFRLRPDYVSSWGRRGIFYFLKEETLPSVPATVKALRNSLGGTGWQNP